MLQRWKHLVLWKKILVGLVLGAAFGLGCPQWVGYVRPLGDLFLNAIHMMVAPVIFTGIVGAVIAAPSPQIMQAASWRVAIVYGLSMLLAAIIGVIVALWVQPGADAGIHLADQVNASSAVQWSALLPGLIPRSFFAALVDEHVVQIVVFALIFGFSIRLAGDEARVVGVFFESLSAVVFKLAEVIVSWAHYGIFALIAWSFGHFGWQVVWPLLSLLAAVYLGCGLMGLVYALAIWLVTPITAGQFFRKILPALTFAFSTSSSAATLPVSIQCAEQGLALPGRLSRFLLPLGASFNLNGLSIYLVVAVLFAANLYHVTLTTAQLVQVVVSVVLMAMGAAAVPGSALVVMGAVMASVGLPLGALALIAGVDRLNDMMQTATNVAGDLLATTVVSYSVSSEDDPSLPE